MKLPPKTLHNRHKDFDDVSDSTMNFHPKNFTSNNNGDEASEGYDEARSEVMSDTDTVEDATSYVSTLPVTMASHGKLPQLPRDTINPSDVHGHGSFGNVKFPQSFVRMECR